jgi:hypothetical protein
MERSAAPRLHIELPMGHVDHWVVTASMDAKKPWMQITNGGQNFFM